MNKDGDVDVTMMDRPMTRSRANEIPLLAINICISKFHFQMLLLIWSQPEANFSIKFLCLIRSLNIIIKQAMTSRNEKSDTKR